MKKWVVYLILHSFLVLCACQPTPEQPAITEKQNTGSFLELAGMQENGKHFRDMDIPDGKYVFSTTGLGGRLSLRICRNCTARHRMPMSRRSLHRKSSNIWIPEIRQDALWVWMQQITPEPSSVFPTSRGTKRLGKGVSKIARLSIERRDTTVLCKEKPAQRN